MRQDTIIKQWVIQAENDPERAAVLEVESVATATPKRTVINIEGTNFDARFSRFERRERIPIKEVRKQITEVYCAVFVTRIK